MALSSTTSVFHSVLVVPPALCSKGHMHAHGGFGGSGAAGVLTFSEMGVFLLSLLIEYGAKRSGIQVMAPSGGGPAEMVAPPDGRGGWGAVCVCVYVLVSVT